MFKLDIFLAVKKEAAVIKVKTNIKTKHVSKSVKRIGKKFIK